MTKQEALKKAEQYLERADSPGAPHEVRVANAQVAQTYIALAAQISDEPVLTQ